MTTYNKTDTIDSVTKDQLELIAETDSVWLLNFIEDRSIFDVHRIRIILELGIIEAKRRVELMRSNDKWG